MKFSDQDSYVLSQLLITARTGVKTDLNVITIENDQVKATNTFINTQNIGNSPVTNVSAVSLVGQQTIGAALGGGDITGGGGYCFIGTTRIETPTGWKYIADIRVGDEVMCFHPITGIREIGIVTHKFEHLSDQHQLVEFEDGSTGTTSEHGYWQKGEYKPISAVEQVWHWDNEWRPRKVLSITDVHEQCALYNLTVSPYHNYFANGDAVSNAKIEPPGGFLDFPPFI